MLIKRSEEAATGDHSLAYYFSYYSKIICHIISLRVGTVSFCHSVTNRIPGSKLAFTKYLCHWTKNPDDLLILPWKAPSSPWFSQWQSKRHSQARVSGTEGWDNPRSIWAVHPPTHLTFSPPHPGSFYVSLPVAVVAFKGLCTCVFPVVPRELIASCKTPFTPFP